MKMLSALSNFDFDYAKLLITTCAAIYVVIFICLFVTASFGRRLGLRKKYIRFLLKVFCMGEEQLYNVTQANQPDKSEGHNNEQEEEEMVVISPELPKAELATDNDVKFRLDYPMHYFAAGMKAIVKDSLTDIFTSDELPTWNMLSRTKRNYVGVSFRMTLFWVIGFIIRYVFLMPTRMTILTISLSWMCLCTFTVGCMPESLLKRKLNETVVVHCFDFVSSTLSLVVRFHNPENRPQCGIAVANHTSPIDSMILATDMAYDMVGQKSKGLLGVFMSALGRSSTHIWFERSMSKDRSKCLNQLRNHAMDPTLPPLLMFPEGACVNNTAVLQFQKGAFEVDSLIYPIAIRFDQRFGDPFWWQRSFANYLFWMMTSWAIVADVWYLPPTHIMPGETAQEFADRVRARIARQGGFGLLGWNGWLKVDKGDRWRSKSSDWKNRQQKEFAKQILKYAEKSKKID